jgi:hypothetical protein
LAAKCGHPAGHRAATDADFEDREQRAAAPGRGSTDFESITEASGTMEHMAQQLADMLQQVTEREFPALQALQDTTTAAPGKWSKQEELGHLLDSAGNNRLRIVRAALEGSFEGPGYDQVGWVALHGYNELPWQTLVEFWRLHNVVLAQLVRRVPEDRLGAPLRIGDNPPLTLGFVIEDYVLHMQHHIDHILGRATVRQYPGAALPS